MATGLSGNTNGVGVDIVNFLSEIAKHFNITIIVTSGFRDAAGQGNAMFKNWIKLKRGEVYSKRALPEVERKKLDEYFTVAQDLKVAAPARTAAQKNFLDLAIKTVGNKSQHTKGRAVDVARSGISPLAYAAIVRRMKEIKEGNRTDIYHFESVTPIPPVSDVDRRAWSAPSGALSRPSGHSVYIASASDLPCTCVT